MNKFNLYLPKWCHFIFIHCTLLPSPAPTIYLHKDFVLTCTCNKQNGAMCVLFLVASGQGHTHMTCSASRCGPVYSCLFYTYIHHTYVCMYTHDDLCPAGSGVASPVCLMLNSPWRIWVPRKEGNPLSSLQPHLVQSMAQTAALVFFISSLLSIAYLINIQVVPQELSSR